MDVLGQFLEEREADGEQDRQRAAEAWQLVGRSPEERLLAFDRWVTNELAKRIDWTWAGAAQEKRIAQCSVRLEGMVLDLWRRGWMLDGKRLAARIVELLDAVATYQKRGRIQDFWAYFNAAVTRYVGANAEEIQREAMSINAHVGNLLGALGVKGAAREPTLPELLAQRREEIVESKEDTLRARLSRKRAKLAACNAEAEQAQLFPE